MRKSTHRIRAAAALACAVLALANNAGAVDLRDWGGKFPASERFVVSSQYTSQAVTDKEAQLAWELSPATEKASRHSAGLPARFDPQMRDAAGVCLSSTGSRDSWIQSRPATHSPCRRAMPF